MLLGFSLDVLDTRSQLHHGRTGRKLWWHRNRSERLAKEVRLPAAASGICCSPLLAHDAKGIAETRHAKKLGCDRTTMM